MITIYFGNVTYCKMRNQCVLGDVEWVIVIPDASSHWVPSHNQSNFFPPNWRQLERQLTSATMEQLLVSINGLRLTSGFMRSRAFSIPFILLWFVSSEFMINSTKSKDKTTAIFEKCTFIEKLLSTTKHLKCHKTCFFIHITSMNNIILYNTWCLQTILLHRPKYF